MKLNGTHSLPDEICPEYNENILCKHGNRFESNQLKLYSQNAILYHDQGEMIVPTKIFCRQSTRCRCSQQLDTHTLGYFNIDIKIMQFLSKQFRLSAFISIIQKGP